MTTAAPDPVLRPATATDGRTLAAMAVTVVLWASAFVGIRMTGTAFSPGALTLGRLVVGSVCLGAAVLVTRPARPRGGDLVPIAVYGLLWFGGYNLALNAAERYLDAGTAALLVNVGPILIAVLSGVFLHEGLPRPLAVGGLVAFGGVAVIAVGNGARAHVGLVGVLLALLAAVLYAAGVVVQKPVVGRVDALQATWLGCTVGALAALPFAPQLVAEAGRAGTAPVLGVVYLGVFPTAVAFTTWAYALRRSTAGRLGATTYLVPAVAILLSWAVLGETPSAWGLLGGAVCVVGVLVTRRR